MIVLAQRSKWSRHRSGGSAFLALLVVLVGSPPLMARAATCLNGIVEAGEGCEGDVLPCLACQCIDGYSSFAGVCQPICGDGVLSPGEPCDDGNRFDGDGCDSNCTLPACGNRIVDSGEECDAGGVSPSCDADCTFAECGDGTINRVAGEGCDPPGSNCTELCQSATCGNGIIDSGSGELCDDENAIDNDGCDSNCTPTACGNGVRTGAEGCDDGNLIDGDGCDSNCTASACGNGIRAGLEACEPPESGSCNASCHSATCGDGVLDTAVGEQCDDGNLSDDDGCDSDCSASACGNGIINSGEECDDGNLVADDLCSNTCLINATCPPALQLTCSTATAAKLSIRSSRFLPKKNGIRWFWQGSDVEPARFGDPRLFGTTSYALCVYDSSGLVHESRGPAAAVCAEKDCWVSDPRGGYAFRDVETFHGGLRKVDLRPGPTSTIRWRSVGRRIRPIVPLPLNPEVTVQLVNSEGECWSSTLGVVKRNDQTQFEAK